MKFCKICSLWCWIFCFHRLSGEKKIFHCHQWEAVKMKNSPIKTADLAKIHRKKYSFFKRWVFVRLAILIIELYIFKAFIAFNAKYRNSYIFSPHSPQTLQLLATFWHVDPGTAKIGSNETSSVRKNILANWRPIGCVYLIHNFSNQTYQWLFWWGKVYRFSTFLTFYNIGYHNVNAMQTVFKRIETKQK